MEKPLQYLFYFPLLLTLVGASISRSSTSIRDNEASLTTVVSTPCFPFMVAFGDSLTDTGNSLFSSDPQPSAYWPYGETYFHQATGRCSDGRLITDFILQTLGLPLLDPYLDPTRNNTINGKTFAVGGATAMDLPWLARLGIHPSTSSSLDVQLQWFKAHKTNVCWSLHLNAKQCNEHFSEVLFFFGEIGGNDLNYGLLLGKSVSEVSSYIPHIIEKISVALDTLVQEGARFIIVEDAPPMGCLPVFTQSWSRRNTYDRTDCVSVLNDLPQQHNALLRKLVNSLQVKYPHVQFLYFDFYNAFYDVLENAESEGITNTWAPCYVGRSQHISEEQAESAVRLCSHPQNYASWDGLHPTEAMYRAIARRLLVEDGFQRPFPNFLRQRCNMIFPDDDLESQERVATY